MQLGLHRLPSLLLFKVCSTVKMASRSSLDYANFVFNPITNNSPLADNEGKQPKSWNTSEDAYEEAFPSLSASINSAPKGKRRTRIDLGACPQQKFEKEGENNGQYQHEQSASINHEIHSSLPTSFGRKPTPSASRSQKLHKNHHDFVGPKKSSVFSMRSDNDEPFDICISETINRNGQRSSVNGQGSRTWSRKEQLAEEDCQDKHNMEMKNDFELPVEEASQVLRPGMVLLKSYIPLNEQVEIVKRCRELGLSPGGFYRPGYDDGAKLRLYMMCLGLDWNAQTRKYGKRRYHDGAAPPDIPNELISLVSRVLDDSHNLIKREFETANVEDILPRMSPDVCIVNYYTTNGRLGLHQDRDESQESLLNGLPVVSLSIGDSAEFLYGDERNVNKAKSIMLKSGDVLIFGGESRHIFHGVTTIYPNTAPQALLENSKVRPGRLNLTFRKY